MLHIFNFIPVHWREDLFMSVHLWAYEIIAFSFCGIPCVSKIMRLIVSALQLMDDIVRSRINDVLCSVLFPRNLHRPVLVSTVLPTFRTGT